MLSHRYRDSGVLDVEGADRVLFLQGQLTQDVQIVKPGDVRPAAGLTPKGKLLYVARLCGLSDRLRLLVPAAVRARVTAHLNKYAVFQKVTVSDRSADWLRVGLYGGPWPEGGPQGAQRLPGEGEFSAELLVPASLRPALESWLGQAGSLPPAPERAEALRVAAGRPRFGVDMDETNLPDEVNLEPAISRTKGCYVGQEIVARLSTYGRVNRRLVGFRFPGGPIPAGARLSNPDEAADRKIEWGRVTSSADSAAFGPIGLGFAFRDVALGSRLVWPEDPSRPAVAAGLPFA
ncbi:MAG: YgfZ/GcvT domain-containing protein [Thermoanaerobaculia bacterium]